MKKVLIVLGMVMLIVLGCIFLISNLKLEGSGVKQPDNQTEQSDIKDTVGIENEGQNLDIEKSEEKSIEPVGILISSFIEFVDSETFNEEDYLKEHEGYISAKVNEDGQLVVEIEEWKQQELLKSLKGGIDAILNGLAVDGDYPFIKSVKVVDDEYREIIITVDKEEFDKNDKMFIKFVATSIGSYQTYSKKGYNVSISVIDIDTNEELLLEKYPEVLEEELKEIQRLEEENKNVIEKKKENYENISNKEDSSEEKNQDK